MDIGIITCHRAFNYGAVLQAYALQKFLSDKGHKVEIIDYTPEYIRKSYNKSLLKRLVRPVLRYYDFKKSNKVFGRFLEDNVKLTKKRYYSYEELVKDPPNLKCFIAGSDQIWNCNIENGKDDAFFLRFINNDKIKISYAASIAMDKIPEDQKERFKKNLQDFNYISVREQTAINLLQQIGIKNVEKVLDPVYLLKKEQWDEVAKKSSLDLKNKKYILAYGFKRQKNLYQYARELATRKGYKLYSINTNFEDKFLDVDKYFYNATPNDFVNLVKNAQEIVTNSFHGLSFSIIYNKPVHQFKKSGNENSRMTDLLKELKISERLVNERNEIIENMINYEETNNIINKNRKKSIDFLNKSLGEKNGED